MTNIISLKAVKAKSDERGAFLGLLQSDLEQHPERVEPIPAGLLARMAAIREQVEKKRQDMELLEG